jgi:hypothetical protein
MLTQLDIGKVKQSKWEKASRMGNNDSTSPALDQSGLEASIPLQIQSKNIFDRDWTNHQFFENRTEPC